MYDGITLLTRYIDYKSVSSFLRKRSTKLKNFPFGHVSRKFFRYYISRSLTNNLSHSVDKIMIRVQFERAKLFITYLSKLSSLERTE